MMFPYKLIYSTKNLQKPIFELKKFTRIKINLFVKSHKNASLQYGVKPYINFESVITYNIFHDVSKHNVYIM